jgi:Ca2+-binding RTX toxin-like protein
MAGLTILASHDYRADPIGVLDDVHFNTLEAQPLAIFNASQLASGLFVKGDGQDDQVEVRLGAQDTFSAAGWVFDAWSGDVIIKGNAADNRITGPTVAGEIHGGAGDDRLKGGDSSDLLYGDKGSDTLIGRGGADALYGGSGNDVLTGGTRGDAFIFGSRLNPTTNVDHITDFAHDQGDKIVLSQQVMSALSWGGFISSLAADAFFLGTHAADDSDRIIYDRPHGKLFYDTDGNGSHGKILFAILDNQASLHASDFFIVG